VANGSRALDLALLGPTDVAVEQNAELYIADTGANQIVRCSKGRLFEVVRSSNGLFQGVYGVGAATDRASADGVDGLVMNREGELYIAGAATKALLIVLPNGRLVGEGTMTTFYPRGDGGLAVGPSGQIVDISGESIGSVRSDGVHISVNFWYRHLPDGIGGVRTERPSRRGKWHDLRRQFCGKRSDCEEHDSGYWKAGQRADPVDPVVRVTLARFVVADVL